VSKSDEWKPTRWWRVLGPDDSLWCETSSEKEARDSLKPGYSLQQLYEKVERRWRFKKARATRKLNENPDSV
jgi:hypothetical protein